MKALRILAVSALTAGVALACTPAPTDPVPGPPAVTSTARDPIIGPAGALKVRITEVYDVYVGSVEVPVVYDAAVAVLRVHQAQEAAQHHQLGVVNGDVPGWVYQEQHPTVKFRTETVSVTHGPATPVPGCNCQPYPTPNP